MTFPAVLGKYRQNVVRKRYGTLGCLCADPRRGIEAHCEYRNERYQTDSFGQVLPPIKAALECSGNSILAALKLNVFRRSGAPARSPVQLQHELEERWLQKLDGFGRSDMPAGGVEP